MLSAQEINGSRFDKIMGRGYRPEQVDAFLQQVSSEYAHLQKKNEELEQKLLVLADRLEEYKRDEDSLRSALIGAQKLGDSVIREAKEKAAAILEDANAKAALHLENARRTAAREQKAHENTRREIALFKGKLLTLYKRHLELIHMLPSDIPDEAEHTPAPAPAPAASDMSALSREDTPDVPALSSLTDPELYEPPEPISSPPAFADHASTSEQPSSSFLQRDPLDDAPPPQEPLLNTAEEIPRDPDFLDTLDALDTIDSLDAIASSLADKDLSGHASIPEIPLQEMSEPKPKSPRSRSGRNDLLFGKNYSFGKKK